MSQTTPSDIALFRKLWPFLKAESRFYAVAFALAPISAGLLVLQPWLLKRAIDDYIEPADIVGLEYIAVLYLIVVISAFITDAGHSLALSYGAMRSIASLREAVYRHTLGLAPAFFDREPTGRLLTRATSDVEALGDTLTAGALAILIDTLQVVGILIAMFILDTRLTLVLLLVAPPLAFIVDRLRRVLRRLFIEVRTSLAELNAFLSERLTGLQVIQLYGDESRALKEFDGRLGRYRNATIRTNIFDALLFAVVDGLASVTMALMLWYGSGGLLEGAVTAGLLAAFIDYIAKLFRPVREFSQKVAVIQRAIAALQKIFSLMDHDEHITAGTRSVVEPKGHIVLRDVHFAYREGNDVLQGVDLEIRPGEVVAIVGRTGSGKTTIGRLLIRAYDGYRGQITIDGIELSQLHPDAVRKTLGMVHQDTQLFSDTVAFNLSLGKEVRTADMHQAIRLTQAQPIVDRLGGLSGTIEQQGNHLSVGEAQLLSFARTMAHDPPIVILDEATASVDSLTEARIQEATKALLERKTVLVIAHRLSTITHADHIAVMDHGRVVEFGPHDKLMALDGAYAHLFRQQFEVHA